MSALVLDHVSKSFGAMAVINDLSLSVEHGSRHAVIGPNGAGKTTLFNLITGWLKLDAGSIRFNGVDTASFEAHELPHRGLARSFQRNALMNGLTVAENLRLAAQGVHKSRYRLFADRSGFGDVLAAAQLAARQMGLLDVLDRKVSELSYGQKRQLEVAMALTSRPRVLLLDEPAAGTSPNERVALIDLINELPRDVTLLLVEHDMDVVFEVCDLITVLNYGELLATGTAAEVRANSDVRTAYLGKVRDA
jgi:branched-chain amino acid transport system ATP-binding protein